ncbi:MAG: DUF362 domain-containing protein [Armatimonadetes bacterium]|nr:DUF362 domain-containing protein [Armatimonadota bacterium]NIM23959.1 DUF362 domain-containing protein [Armatimonadota bacterium]NIM67806.1 DUF362 domain-containing protein [Armatimonadota bacterium]NIM76346.1 DUF362 domain-containing protein [Armatimonadota bacterium]NIN06040.1 DUF362 domain-containing protein [Armatimonadota bacterium]
MPTAKKKRSQDSVAVYFASVEQAKAGGIYQGLKDVFRRTKVADSIEKGDVVAIKVHFGELGNTRYLRPAFVRRLVDLVKDAGGRPFVTDTTTLYRHHRHDLFQHLETARANGFTPETLGCPVLIADGIKNNGVDVKVRGNKLIPTVNVAQAIYDADVIINAAHLTFHCDFVWGGTIKGLGMGCTTRKMKLLMHQPSGKPIFHRDRCVNCGLCLQYCAGEAFTRKRGRILFDADKCVGCGECIVFCTGHAITLAWGEAWRELILRTAECGRGVLSTFAPEKAWHFLFALDITGDCDCIGASEGQPALPDMGIFASQSPVATDLAALDIAEKAGLPEERVEAVQTFRKLIAESVLPSVRCRLNPI